MSTCSTSSSAKKSGAAASAKKSTEVKYQMWDTTAADSHEYSGDTSSTVDFFKENSNYDELIGSMSSDERDAFMAWTEGHFMRGQMYKNFRDIDPWDQKWVRMYDKILDKSELKQGIVVTRLSTAELLFGKGKKTATLAELEAMKGEIVHCKSCLSAGAAKEGLTIGASKKIEYSIKIPPGKGHGMWVGDKRINGWGAKQREFMINRDAGYKVGKTTFDSKRKVYVVELEMLGVNAHDYS